MAELLESEPLHSKRAIRSLWLTTGDGLVDLPKNLNLHCDNPQCDGVRRHFKSDSSEFVVREFAVYVLAVYRCSNCEEFRKLFGLKSVMGTEGKSLATCTKIYQEPPFGQPIPKRLFEVIGEENREHFLQARRAIARGLGIGAHAYYRRIVENTKFELVGSVLKVAQATNAAPEQIEQLKKAQIETRFSAAIDMLRDASAIPPILLIDGHNPLALLHDALSEGIHQLDDVECLQRAKDAEVILCEVADRIRIALTDRQSVKAALASITKRKSPAGGAAAKA
jgi:hypothetical protein